MTKIELIQNANGNQLGQGREARAFFDMRGFANRRPGQDGLIYLTSPLFSK
jgi:hypothetical protein